MFPVTHAVLGVGAAKAGERLFPSRWLPLDFRFAALGGLLPDLIDKPLAWYVFPSWPDDHLWAHSAWFPAFLILAGILLAQRNTALPVGSRRLNACDVRSGKRGPA
jgi:hypothetical protein